MTPLPPTSDPPAAVPAPSDGWIRGEIDADYVGTPNPLDASLTVTITRALIRRPVQVTAPPTDSDALEIRQGTVQAWLVLDGTQYPTRLHDLRLRAWVDHPSGSPRAGRLSGTVWARLLPQKAVPSTTAPAPTAAMAPPPEPPRQVPTTNWLEEVLRALHAIAAAGFLFVAGFVVLLATSAWLAGVWAVGAIVPWMFRPWFAAQTRRWSRAFAGFAGMLVGLASLGLVVIALREAGAAPCDPRSWWFVAALAVPVYFAAFLRPVWPIDLATLLWTVGIVAWGIRPDAACLGADALADEGGPAEVRALQRAAVQIHDRAGEALAADDTARLLAATNERLSVSAALADPDAMCRLPVVLSAALLFAPDSDVLDPVRAEPHLRKLRRALAAHPARPVTVHAHTSSTGDRSVDLAHSERQAQSVIRWFAANARPRGVVGEGLGASHPVVDDPALAALNHRLEVVVDCD